MQYEKPEVGVTYEPGPDIEWFSEGLPRTVTLIETRPDLDVFVVHYTNDDGEGWASGNLWARWVQKTGARPAMTAS